jgi:hypothetical protein
LAVSTRRFSRLRRGYRGRAPMRAIFAVYLVVIVAGVVLFAIVGLTHN